MRRLSDQEQIAQGTFYTEAEIRAKPWLRRHAQAAAAQRRDPNDTQPSKEARELTASGGVCAYCWEPADERSALDDGLNPMHSECREAWNAEHAER